MDSEQLKMILENHEKWLRGEDGGERADLSEADLSGLTLSKANLSRAILIKANLSRAILSEAILSEANLKDITFFEAKVDNLVGTKLFTFSLDWKIAIDPKFIRIGCEYHSHLEWENFLDEEIEGMSEDALPWWKKHKTIILNLAKISKESLNNMEENEHAI